MTAAKVAQQALHHEDGRAWTRDEVEHLARFATRVVIERDDLLAALRQAMPVLERAAATERVANRLTGGAGTQANDALTASEFAIKQAEK